MNYAEQIAAFEADRAAKAGAQKTLIDEVAAKGETLDEQGQEQFDTLQGEIEAIDAHLKRLRLVEKTSATGAAPVAGTSSDDGQRSRGGEPIIVKTQPKLEPGIAFARLAKMFGMAKGSVDHASRLALARYGEQSDTYGVLKRLSEGGFSAIEKAEIPAGSTVAGTWAVDLVGAESTAFADFVEFLRPMTILGKFGNGGIPSLRNVPFRTALISQTGGGAAYWVGEGKPKPLTNFDFNRSSLTPLKVANICVLTDEVIRDSSPSAEAIVRDELANAIRSRVDIDFISPSNAGTANVKPASITNGADAIAASGTGDADDVRLDIRSLLQKYVNANNPASSLVIVMRAGDALALGMMVNALGQPEFPAMGLNGGNLLGLPVITSENVPSGVVVAVNASDIYFADDGDIRLDMSREASLEMLDSALQQSGVADVNGASLVSLWQNNMVGFLAERTLNWSRRRTEAVTYLTGVAWGGAVST